MAKISNKKYEQFWDKDEIMDGKNGEEKVKVKDDSVDIKKEIKKEVKKEISKLKNDEKVEVKEKPKRKPRAKKPKEVVEKKKIIKPKPKPKVKEVVIEPKKEVVKEVKEVIVLKKEVVINTIKDMYMQYITDNIPYKIYFRSQLLFDSIKHGDGPILYDDHFILFGKKYIYRGIRFEKY